jgi:hypothetical protein
MTTLSLGGTLYVVVAIFISQVLIGYLYPKNKTPYVYIIVFIISLLLCIPLTIYYLWYTWNTYT